MEDLDTPRCVAGAADDILRKLEVFELHSDEPIIYQSQRTAAYEEALQHLKESGAVYPCCCTRKEIADSAMHGIEGLVYPGTCRDGIPAGREARAWRVRTDIPPRHSGVGRNDGPINVGGIIEFADALQGHTTQQLEKEIGDFVVKRADGLFAYQLAVVVDDAAQGITHVVRGADLVTSTARQIWLQRLLGLPTPHYMHLPVAINAAGEKLSKQTLAAPVNFSQPAATLLRVLDFLQQHPPAELSGCDVRTVLDWAIQNWDAKKLQGIKAQPYLIIDGATNPSTKPSSGQVAGYPA